MKASNFKLEQRIGVIRNVLPHRMVAEEKIEHHLYDNVDDFEL